MSSNIQKSSFKKNLVCGLALLGFIGGASIAQANEQLMTKLFVESGGIWVEVFQNGTPMAGAVVNDGYVTDQSGRTFVYTPLHQRKSMLIQIQTQAGDLIYRQIRLKSHLEKQKAL